MISTRSFLNFELQANGSVLITPKYLRFKIDGKCTQIRDFRIVIKPIDKRRQLPLHRLNWLWLERVGNPSQTIYTRLTLIRAIDLAYDSYGFWSIDFN